MISRDSLPDMVPLLQKNTFSEKLGRHSLNFFALLVVDLMHEFELGIWKSLFVHLLRILYCQDKSRADELDCRYVLFTL